MVAYSSLPLSTVNALDIGKRSRAAAMGLLFYDHVITFDREVNLIWSKPKNWPPFLLYLFNRFFALLYLIFDSIPLTPSGVVSSRFFDDTQWISTLVSSRCVIYLMCDDLVTLVTTITVQTVLQLRVYALYERNSKILILLLTLSAMEVATMAVLVGITISRLSHLPVVSTPTGCYYSGVITLSALFWVPGLIYEPILFALVAYKAWWFKRKGPRIPLVSRIARDSLVYFVLVFAELLIATLIWAINPTYINIIMPWSAALPSILCSRLLLNMRDMVNIDQGNKSYIMESFSTQVDTLAFQMPVGMSSDSDSPDFELSTVSIGPESTLQKRNRESRMAAGETLS
ncbi:hypothetical protein QCA50_002348 [Cerrena zonata]|uniref:DUF6533 domain-containing protein n=1 Tax=Cerrena zonata TaxID=2478898 RepID=A0AAW0GNH2_9APHY